MASLVAHAEAVVGASGGRAEAVGVRIGALSGVQPEALEAHWGRFAGPLLADARLVIEAGDDPRAPDALGVSLAYVEVHECAKQPAAGPATEDARPCN